MSKSSERMLTLDDLIRDERVMRMKSSTFRVLIVLMAQEHADVSMSIRSIARITRLDRDTVASSVKTLLNEGFMLPVGGDDLHPRQTVRLADWLRRYWPHPGMSIEQYRMVRISAVRRKTSAESAEREDDAHDGEHGHRAMAPACHDRRGVPRRGVHDRKTVRAAGTTDPRSRASSKPA